MAEFRSVQ